MSRKGSAIFQQAYRLTFVRYRSADASASANAKPSTSYSVREIEIPAPVGHIAGKLWEPNEPTNSETQMQPPIICLHGWLDNAGSFDGVIPLIMKADRKFLALDLPGHGRTTYCPISHYDGLTEALIAIERASLFFEWEKFSLLGHSMGSIASFLYSGLFPDRVHKYMGLENFRPLFRDGLELLRSSISLVFEVEKRMKSPKLYNTYEEILQKFYIGRMETITMEGCKTLLERGVVMTPEGKYQFSHNLRTLIPPAKSFTEDESLEIGKEIKCPMCLIKADPGNIYQTAEAWDEFIKCLRENSERVEVYSIPGTHHFHVNDPQLVARVLNKFLDS